MLTESVLLSTKKVLGIAGPQDAFDQEILTHINSAFSVLAQLGVFPEAGVMVNDVEFLWSDLVDPNSLDPDDPDPMMVSWVQHIRTYVFLFAQMMFDPPTTGFLMTARQRQLDEHVWRISTMREYSIREEEADESEDVDA